jgi:hypothetical protein
MIFKRDKSKAGAAHSTSSQEQKSWQAIKALQSVGGLQKRVIFWFIILVVLVNVLSGWLQNFVTTLLEPAQTSAPANCAQGLLQGLYCKIVNDPRWLNFTMLVVVLFILFVCVGCLRKRAIKSLPEVRPIVSTKHPESPVVLVLFLSTPNLKSMSGAGMPEDLALEGLAKLGLQPPDTRNPFREMLGVIGSHIKVSRAKKHDLFSVPGLRVKSSKAATLSPREIEINTLFATCNWRMMVDGIRPYLEANSNLREIIFIPSSDGRRFNGYDANGKELYSPNNGSVHNVEEAKAFVELIIRSNGFAVGHDKPNGIWVRSCGELKHRSAEEKVFAPSVDYGNLKQMTDMLYEITREVRARHRCQEQDILVDNTSGTVIASVSAAAYSTLVENRRFQYVNTTSYETLTFDVTHQFDLGT